MIFNSLFFSSNKNDIKIFNHKDKLTKTIAINKAKKNKTTDWSDILDEQRTGVVFYNVAEMNDDGSRVHGIEHVGGLFAKISSF